jgi:hypothetical protein
VAEAYARMVQADPDKAAKVYDSVEKNFITVPNPNSQQMIEALVKGGITREPRGPSDYSDNSSPFNNSNNNDASW